MRERRWYVFGGVLAALAALAVAGLWSASAPSPRSGGWDQKPLEGLRQFGAVPDFALTERTGAPLRLADLRGKVWIVNFIYTSCTDTCPLQSAEMSRLQYDLSENADVRLVSITVDPDGDTPEVLSRYAERYHADSDRWLFLTGSPEEISRLVQQGFRLSVGTSPGNGGQESPVLIHSSRFVLVDGNAQIRGYYPADDAAALDRLRADLRKLLEEKGA